LPTRGARVERGNSWGALEDGDALAGPEAIGQPPSGEHTALVVVGGNDSGLGGEGGQVVVDQHDFDALGGGGFQCGLHAFPDGGDRDAIDLLDDHRLDEGDLPVDVVLVGAFTGDHLHVVVGLIPLLHRVQHGQEVLVAVLGDEAELGLAVVIARARAGAENERGQKAQHGDGACRCHGVFFSCI
jgi:hypothetical protein